MHPFVFLNKKEGWFSHMKKETAIKIIRERAENYALIRLRKRYTPRERRDMVSMAVKYAKEHLGNNPSHEQVDYVTDVIIESTRKI